MTILLVSSNKMFSWARSAKVLTDTHQYVSKWNTRRSCGDINIKWSCTHWRCQLATVPTSCTYQSIMYSLILMQYQCFRTVIQKVDFKASHVRKRWYIFMKSFLLWKLLMKKHNNRSWWKWITQATSFIFIHWNQGLEKRKYIN